MRLGFVEYGDLNCFNDDHVINVFVVDCELVHEHDLCYRSKAYMKVPAKYTLLL